jgi:hypothetical protein
MSDHEAEVLIEVGHPSRPDRVELMREHIESIKARAKAEGAAEVVAAVRAVFDMQCPPIRSRFADDDFGRGAYCAHTWWNTVLGYVLRAGATDA